MLIQPSQFLQSTRSESNLRTLDSAAKIAPRSSQTVCAPAGKYFLNDTSVRRQRRRCHRLTPSSPDNSCGEHPMGSSSRWSLVEAGSTCRSMRTTRGTLQTEQHRDRYVNIQCVPLQCALSAAALPVVPYRTKCLLTASLELPAPRTELFVAANYSD